MKSKTHSTESRQATDSMERQWWTGSASARNTKGTPVTMDAEIGHIFNSLPPGQDIESQEVADVSDMVRKNITASGYPGSGGFTDPGDTVTGKTYKP